jgi:hypothetical protein
MPFNQSPIVPSITRRVRREARTSTGMSLTILNPLFLSAILRPVREQRSHSWAPGIGSSSSLTAWKHMCIMGVFNCTQGTAIVFGHFGYTNFLIDPFVIVANDHMSARNKSQVSTLPSKVLLRLVSRLARPRVICLKKKSNSSSSLALCLEFFSFHDNLTFNRRKWVGSDRRRSVKAQPGHRSRMTRRASDSKI